MRKWISILYSLVLWFVTTPVYGQDATTTELAQQGRSLKSEIFTLDNGLVTNISDLLRDKDSAAVLNNLQMTKRGVWTTNDIGRSAYTMAGSNTSDAVYELAQHTTSAGVNRLVAANATKIESVAISGSTATYTNIGTPSGTPAGLPCMRSYNATNFLYCDGGANPQKWNGDPSSAMTNLSGWPISYASVTYEKPKFVEIFANRACWAGLSGRPSSIVFSDQNDPATYTIGSSATNGGVFECPSQLGSITGMRTLRLSNDTNDQVLIIGCERGMAIITGYSGSTFALKDLTREYGLRSNRSWVQLQNDLYFLASDGIRRFSQLITNASLVNSSLTFPVQDLVNQLSTPSGTGFTAVAVHHSSTQEVVFYVATTSFASATYGAGNAIVLNYNTEASSGEALKPIISTKSWAGGALGTISAAIDYGGTLIVGTNALPGGSGQLLQEYSGDTYGDGSAIAWEYMSPLIGGNSPSQSASLRKFVVITEGGDQAFTASAYTLDTMANGNTEWKARDSRSYSVTSSTITKIGTWASGTTTTYPKLIDVTSTGNGRYWGLRLSGSSTTGNIALVGVQAILTVGGLKQ